MKNGLSCINSLVDTHIETRDAGVFFDEYCLSQLYEFMCGAEFGRLYIDVVCKVPFRDYETMSVGYWKSIFNAYGKVVGI